MNRRQFIQISGAIGALAVIPMPVAKALESIAEKDFGNFEVKWMGPGVDVRVSTEDQLIWHGTTTGKRLYGKIPTEVNGKEINIRFAKRGYDTLEIRGHKFPADGSTLKIIGWLEEEGPKPHTGEAIERGEFLAEPIAPRKFRP